MSSSSVHCQKRGRLTKVFETLDPYDNLSLVISGSQVMKTHHEIVCSRVITGCFVLLKFTRQR